jgi:hypothetical protein
MKIFTTDELDKHYRMFGPSDDRHQALAIRRVLFRDNGVLVELEPDNSLRRDVWRLDRDDVELVLRSHIMKGWEWPSKAIRFVWSDEKSGMRRQVPVVTRRAVL